MSPTTPSDKDTGARLALASKYVDHTFGNLVLTLELAFKDKDNLHDPDAGWSGARTSSWEGRRSRRCRPYFPICSGRRFWP
jgi:hypothetical protein